MIMKSTYSFMRESAQPLIDKTLFSHLVDTAFFVFALVTPAKRGRRGGII
jgi:hypothetical protein